MFVSMRELGSTLVVACAALAGCGDDAQGDGSGGTGETSSSVAPSTSTGSSPTSDASGSTSSAGDTGGGGGATGGSVGEGGVACEGGTTDLRVSAVLADGTAFVAEDGSGNIAGLEGPHIDLGFSGAIRREGDAFVVDECHPDDDCEPRENVLHLLDVGADIPDGTFVRVRIHVDVGEGLDCVGSCEAVVAITVINLSVWGDHDNPTEAGEHLWAHVTSGSGYHGPDGFSFDSAEECRTTDEQYTSVADVVVTDETSGESVTVANGATEDIVADGGLGYAVHNLQHVYPWEGQMTVVSFARASN